MPVSTPAPSKSVCRARESAKRRTHACKKRLVEQTLKTNANLDTATGLAREASLTHFHSHVSIFVMIEEVHDWREDGLNKRGRIRLPIERLGVESAGYGRKKSPHVVPAANIEQGETLSEICRTAGGIQHAYFGATRWATAGSIVDMVATMPLRRGASACSSARSGDVQGQIGLKIEGKST